MMWLCRPISSSLKVFWWKRLHTAAFKKSVLIRFLVPFAVDFLTGRTVFCNLKMFACVSFQGFDN